MRQGPFEIALWPSSILNETQAFGDARSCSPSRSDCPVLRRGSAQRARPKGLKPRIERVVKGSWKTSLRLTARKRWVRRPRSLRRGIQPLERERGPAPKSGLSFSQQPGAQNPCPCPLPVSPTSPTLSPLSSSKRSMPATAPGTTRRSPRQRLSADFARPHIMLGEPRRLRSVARHFERLPPPCGPRSSKTFVLCVCRRRDGPAATSPSWAAAAPSPNRPVARTGQRSGEAAARRRLDRPRPASPRSHEVLAPARSRSGEGVHQSPSW